MQRSVLRHDVLLPGIIGGLIAGFVVALWFLGLDLIAGRPLATPAILGQAILQLPDFTLSARLLAGYTIMHFGMFVLLGVGAAWFLRIAQLTPSLLLGVGFGVVAFDVAYYGALLVTGASMFEVLAWYQVVPANALAGIALMAYFRRAFHEAQPTAWGRLRGQPVVREGVMAGLVGAVAVALWFLVIDVLSGRPLHTPAALGSGLLLGAQSESEVRVSLGLIAAYSMMHVAAFVVAGLLMAAAATYLEGAPSRALLVLLATLLLEAASLMTVLLGAEWVLGAVGLWAVTAANAIAVAVMAWVIWRGHRTLPERLRHATVDV